MGGEAAPGLASDRLVGRSGGLLLCGSADTLRSADVPWRRCDCRGVGGDAAAAAGGGDASDGYCLSTDGGGIDAAGLRARSVGGGGESRPRALRSRLCERDRSTSADAGECGPPVGDAAATAAAAAAAAAE